MGNGLALAYAFGYAGTAGAFEAAPTIPPPANERLCLVASGLLLAAVALFLACC